MKRDKWAKNEKGKTGKKKEHKSKEGTERLKRNGMARLEGKTECVRKQKERIK